MPAVAPRFLRCLRFYRLLSLEQQMGTEEREFWGKWDSNMKDKQTQMSKKHTQYILKLFHVFH